MALLNQDQTQLLTYPGFVNQFETYWQREGLTQEKAFDEANRDVKLLTGEPRYEGDKYHSFITQYKQRRAQAKKE